MAGAAQCWRGTWGLQDPLLGRCGLFLVLAHCPVHLHAPERWKITKWATISDALTRESLQQLGRIPPNGRSCLGNGRWGDPAFLREPWGLTQQLGSRWAGAHTLTGGLSALTQQERQDWASWALRALHQKALTSHRFPATLPSALALGFVGPAVGAGGDIGRWELHTGSCA